MLSAVIFIITLWGGYDRLPLYISGTTMVLLAVMALMIVYL
jgi:hypothetical protein